MGLLDFLKRSKEQEPFTKTVFECRRDDLTIRGTEYRPVGDNLPVAIVCHGFMAFRDTEICYAPRQIGDCAVFYLLRKFFFEYSEAGLEMLKSLPR